MSKHTPGPWVAEVNHIVARTSAGEILNGGSSIAMLYGHETKANAAYIVKCVNSHEDLLEALKGMVHGLTEDVPIQELGVALVKARAAIKKATEE